MRKKLKDRPGMNFPMLSDTEHRVIDRYGLLNEKATRQIPHPATFVIDLKGNVTWKFIEVNYKLRPSNEDILKEIIKIETSK